MKFKTTLLKSSLTRRLLSAVLAATMVAGLLPASALAAGTGSTASVEYNRKSPEAAILNAYTGTSVTLYTQLKGDDTQYPKYNAIGLFKKDGSALTYGTQVKDDAEYTWSGYESSVLRGLSSAYNNLEVNLSATFYNREHSHTHGSWPNKHEYTMTSYEGVYLQLGFNSPVMIRGTYPNKDFKYPRVGDYDGYSKDNLVTCKDETAADSYGKVSYSTTTTAALTFLSPSIDYDHLGDPKTCNCSVYAENLLLTFRDARAPQLAGIYYSLDGGSNWTWFTSGLRVKAGSTLLIKLSYDEPIRFADDSAAGKGSLYLELQADGDSIGSGRYAYLTKLDGNDLYFSYTFSEPEVDWNIQTLNMSKLFGSSLTLKQVYGSTSFTLDSSLKNSDGNTIGFSTTTCYITDLAGNALTKPASGGLTAGDLILDSETPYVEKVEFNLTLNNADVKKALGKDTWDPNSYEYQTSYTDASDLYLGVGDTLSLVLKMNERLTDSTLSGYTAVATTNIKDRSGDYVTVESWYFTPRNDFPGDITSWFMNPITMQAGWTVEGSEIKVTALRFEGGSTTITDLAGNALNVNNVTIDDGANANPPWLDVTAPTVTELENSYQLDTGANSFRYGVRISDDKSGVADIYGSFILNNGGDGMAYQYEWAVTADGGTTPTVWYTGTTGVAQQFKQIATTYIHIRPKAGTTYYDLSNCTLTVKAKDYAGNESSALLLPPSGTLTWYIDNLAPTVKAGETTRALKNDPSEGGTLTAKVILTDSNGISKWDYAWSNSDTVAPTSWEQGEVTATSTSNPVTVTASAAVANGELFSQYLWVKATDNSGKENESAPICLGLYTYDLSEAQYNLDYSTGITQKASMKVSSVGADDTLVFLVKGKTDTAYAMLRIDGASLTSELEIFELSSFSWYYGYTCTETSSGRYTLTQTTDAAVQSAVQKTIQNAFGSYYSGELEIVILSGKKTAVSDNGTTAELTLGSESQSFSKDTVTLRAAGENNGDSNYTGISITSSISSSDMGGSYTPPESGSSGSGGSYFYSVESPALSTLAGIEFTISIEEDVNGWNYEDINWTASYVELKIVSSGTNSGTTYIDNLQQIEAATSGLITQTLTIPERDYASGLYSATLYLVCYAGGSPTERQFQLSDGRCYFIVDATEPNNDFSLTSMTYAPLDYYGIGDFYGTLDCLGNTENGVITLPVVDASCGAFGNGDPGESYQFTISSPTELPIATNGSWYELKMWNTADPTNKLTIRPTDNTQKTVQNNFDSYTGSNAYGFVFDTDDVVAGKYLYLAPNQENTVAMQKVYPNGLTSEIKYVRIKPVTGYITGTMSVDYDTRELVFTPDESVASAAIDGKIYAWAWQGVSTSDGERIDMTPEADGTWRCSLLESGAYYKVITVNSAGSIYDTGIISELAPGASLTSFTDNNDGTYELRFYITDDYDAVQNGLKLDIGFNEAYSTDHLSFTIKKGSGLWTEDWTPDHDVYSWTETGTSSTGIYSVRVIKYSDYNNSKESDRLSVIVKGCYKNVTGPMNITLTATDAMGYTGSASTGEQTVHYQKPVIYDDSATVTNSKPTLGSNGLILTFTQPVRPVDSWAWQEADSAVTGFQTQWEGAFPIAGNGTYTLEFVDIFGNTCTQELTTNAFTVNGTDYSMGLYFSTTDMTAETVAVTATSTNGYLTFLAGDGSGTMWKEDGVYDTVRLIDQSGNTWPESSIQLPNGTLIPESYLKNFGTKLREIRWYTNGKMRIRCDTTSTPDSAYTCVFSQTVYIGNIAATAPTADVRYYVYALGKEFSQAELEQYIADNGGSVTVTGNVQVWYKTTRSVTPTEGGSEYLFTPENCEQGHTFAYVDELGHEGSVTVTLPAGLTLASSAVTVDTTAPNVDIDIYTKRSGSYTQEEAFTPSDSDITDKFTALGYVQGYRLKVNASDASGFDIAVSGTGASLSGNIVTITQAGTFTITVTDTSNNVTSVTFTVPEKIDNTAPVGSITVTPDSLYKKTLTITLSDTDDAGHDTGTVTLSLPADAVQDAIDPNKYTYQAKDNGTVEFVFFDQAGNRGTATEPVTGIDTEPPKLTVEWSPPYTSYDSEGNKVVDKSRPTLQTVNTNITARIKSDKAMYDLTVQAGNELTAHELLVAGEARSYSILGQDGKPLVSFTVTPELITVTYSGYYGQKLTFTATTPNGKSTTLTLDGFPFNVIDKEAPVIQVSQVPATRSGYTVPYAVQVTLTPDETVTSPNYGETDNTKQPVKYQPNRSLTLTFTENGTYNVRFVDTAGNVTIVPVVITGIDRTAPVLEVGEPVIIGTTATVVVTVDEACTLKWGESGTYTCTAAGRYGENGEITFTQNGTFAITATDAAGNESFKMVRVGSIDDIAPSISFTSSTIYVMTDETNLDAKLNEGFEYRDNMTAENELTVSIGKTVVDLTKAGQYIVTYTVTDKAGNVTTANRLVRVIGSDTVCLNIDGKLILPDSTAVIHPGDHTLTLENNGDEPYSIKARKGVLSAGQMKYLSGSSLSFDEDGKFSVTSTGYYTLLVTTQSRQTIRILLYVEQ